MVDSYFPSILTTMFIRALLGYLFYSGSPDREFVVEFSAMDQPGAEQAIIGGVNMCTCI